MVCNGRRKRGKGKIGNTSFGSPCGIYCRYVDNDVGSDAFAAT